MKAITFPATYDNEAAHRQVKILMKQNQILNINLDESFALVSTTAVTGLQYMITPDTWDWILNYLQTGDYEDFGIFPSNRPNMVNDFQIACLKELIEKGYNIARIPFIRETTAYIKLRGLFRFGKLFFSIRRTDDFINYLESKGL